MSKENDPKTGAPRRTDESPERGSEPEQDKNPSGQDGGTGEQVNEDQAPPSEVADSDGPAHREPGAGQ